MKRIWKLVLALVVSAFVTGWLATGCATQFLGSAHIPTGRYGCHNICAKWQMEMVGMVAMGQYSTGCVCQVRGRRISKPMLQGAATFAGAASAGVVMQMRRHQQQQQQQ